MKAILFRLGGLGDILILGPVANQLKKIGYEVDACIGSPTGDAKKWYDNTNIFGTIYEYSRVPTGLDVYKVNDKDLAGIDLLKSEYDFPVDYKRSVEMNSFNGHLADKPGREWMLHQNSNFQNWMDIMMAWAGIDPYYVPDEEKRPVYVVSDKEKEWAQKIVGDARVVSMQTSASSLTRTWYHPQLLPTALKALVSDLTFLVFDGSQWQYIRGKTASAVKIPKDFEPVRASAALVAASELFIGADSGFSHIAEAVNVKSLTIYTTVPAWTRNKYYKHSYSIEPEGHTFDGVRCRPCFVLDRYCPRVREKALGQLSERELRLKEAVETNIPPHQIAVELQTTPQGVVAEAQLAGQRFQALLEQQAPCSATITTERVAQKAKEILNESSS